MKKISTVMLTGFLLGFTTNIFSQYGSGTNASLIEPYRLSITFNKTTNLVFPYAIKSVDRGSRDVLAQKAKGIENILQVKAGKQGFEETNLTVITADGKLYSYVLSYTDTPSSLNIQFTNNKDNSKPDAFFSEATTTEAAIQADARNVVNKEVTVQGISDEKYGIKLNLNSLFVRGNVMYYQVTVENSSTISYDIDQIRFFIRDLKRSKRTASQELEIKPLYVYNDTSTIAGRSERKFVFAIPKLTIPDKRYLTIQFMEKNGGRHLRLTLKNKHLMKAKQLM